VVYLEHLRKRLIVTGNVQGVGYRVIVRQIARRLGVKGFVQNLEDGSVEIYTEAPSDIMANFLLNINIWGGSENIFSPSVSSIAEFSSSHKNFRPLKDSFRAFWIRYSENLSAGEKELIEKTEIGGLALAGIDLKLTGLTDETRGFRKETDKNFSSLTAEIKDFRKEANENTLNVASQTADFKAGTAQNFGKLDQKYDSVSDYLKKINSNLEELNSTIKQAAHKFMH